jgi:hypothetical protein
MNQSSNENQTSLGELFQRCDMPPASGMDALEVRLVTVQEVPHRDEVQFFAVRGEIRTRLSSMQALAVLREHTQPRLLTELSPTELLILADYHRSEANRMRPVYEAAKAWRVTVKTKRANFELIAVIDTAIATEIP